MFKNLFKKTKESVEDFKEILTQPENFVNSKVIQKDFDQELKTLIDSLELTGESNKEIENLNDRIKNFRLENMELVENVQKLKDLGFVNTPSATQTITEFENQIKETENKISSIKKDIEAKGLKEEMLKHYNLKFPSFKFIPKDEFLKVLDKYGLVMGEASMYNREIPTKAVNIIHNFKDYIKDNSEGFCFNHNLLDVENVNSIKMKLENERRRLPIPREDGLWAYSINIESSCNELRDMLDDAINISPLKMVAPKDHFTIPTMDFSKDIKTMVRFRFDVLRETDRNQIENLKNINICKMENNIITYDFSKAQKTLGEIKKVLDPIALLVVNDFKSNNVKLSNKLASHQHSFDGVIILDAWDEEANIPEIKNNLLN